MLLLRILHLKKMKLSKKMIDFANLVEEIDKTNKTNQKVIALENFFKNASDEDKVWAIALFSSRKPKGVIKTSTLKVYAAFGNTRNNPILAVTSIIR